MRHFAILIIFIAVLFEMNDLVKSCNGARKQINGLMAEMTYDEEQHRLDSIHSVDSTLYADSVAQALDDWHQALANRDSIRNAAFDNVASWSGKFHVESNVSGCPILTDFTLIPTKAEAYKGQLRIIVDGAATLRGTISGTLEGKRLHINMIRYDYTPEGDNSDPTEIASIEPGHIFTLTRNAQDEYSVIGGSVSPLFSENISLVEKRE